MEGDFDASEVAKLAARHSEFFDFDFIKETSPAMARLSNAETLQSLLDPRNPSPANPNRIFRGDYYTDQRAKRGGRPTDNPIRHFLTEGDRAGLSPNPCFDPVFFRRNAAHRGARAGTTVGIALQTWSVDLPAFHPFIDLRFLQGQLGVRDAQALLDALFSGEIDADHPHPLFDVDYVRRNADRPIATMLDAFEYYWSCGDDLQTHPLFDIDYYKRVASGGREVIHSVYHYLSDPAPRSPQPMFDPDFYTEQTYRASLGVPERPFEHFLRQGQALGIDPSPFFDVAFYRSVSGCGAEALGHYLREGYDRLPPHPLVSLEQDALDTHASACVSSPLGYRLADPAEHVPLAVTPDIVPDPKSVRCLEADDPSPEEALRDDYFRNGYPIGSPPNRLLSLRYIQLQSNSTQRAHSIEVKNYFHLGWHRQPRLLIALASLGESAENQAWLALLRHQIKDPTVEFIVLSNTSGSLVEEFKDLAHVWCLEDTPGPEASTEIAYLRRLLQPNPPVAVLVDFACELHVLDAIVGMDAPKLAFGGLGETGSEAELLERLKGTTRLVLAPPSDLRVNGNASDQAQESADTYPELGRLWLPVQTSKAVRRSDIRRALGLDEDHFVVVSSGPLTLDHGIDLFGALAASCREDSDFAQNVTFLWHGSGPRGSHTPAFYAQHFLDTVSAEITFRIVSDIDFAETLEASDVYVKLCRGTVSNDLLLAKTLGRPVVLSRGAPGGEGFWDGEELLFAPYDWRDARHKLSKVISDLERGTSSPSDGCGSIRTSSVDAGDGEPILLMLSDRDPAYQRAEILGEPDDFSGFAALRLRKWHWAALALPAHVEKLMRRSKSDELIILKSEAPGIDAFIRELRPAISYIGDDPITPRGLVQTALQLGGASGHKTPSEVLFASQDQFVARGVAESSQDA